jgi:hypothetical protein
MKFPVLQSSARALAFGALLFAVSECSVSEQVKDSPSGKTAGATEARENQAYSLVQYRLNFIDEAKLGGQDILFVRQPSDLTSPQQAKLQAAAQAGALPLHLTMRLYARNSSKEDVQLQKLDYQVLLDGKPLTSGSTGANTPIESSAIVTLPVAIDLNVPADRLSGSTPAAFAANLTDFTGSGRRLSMRIRPTYLGSTGRVAPAADFQTVELVTSKTAPTR